MIPVETPYPLGRTVNHDPRNRFYAFDTTGITVVSVKHNRRIPVLDQGNLGSCTGNATVGALGTDPFYATVNSKVQLNETLAVKIYSQATVIDDAPGSYPPDDTGSDGISVAKVAKSLGYISGYTHTFNFDDALKALSTQPVIIGINWYNNFFTPDANGVISIGANDYVAGGHEVVLDEIDVQRQLVGGTNSWGESWGLNGRFYIAFDLFKRLLSEQGDVTAFVPLTQPAPTPVPPTPVPVPAPVPGPDAGFQLWQDIRGWATARHSGSNKVAAAKVVAWAKSNGWA